MEWYQPQDWKVPLVVELNYGRSWASKGTIRRARPDERTVKDAMSVNGYTYSESEPR
jgi:hypothetical protein